MPYLKVLAGYMMEFRLIQTTDTDYGGNLPTLEALLDPVNSSVEQLGSPTEGNDQSAEDDSSAAIPPKARSHLNPFFGYPVTSDVRTLRHGRRRKRDLARTLLVLWWERNRVTIQACLVVLTVLLLVRLSKSRVAVKARSKAANGGWRSQIASYSK